MKYEYDKDYPFAAYVTNLGKYNDGELAGEWVEMPTTPEHMKEVFDRIGIGSKDEFGQPYEEFFITDYDDYSGVHITKDFGEYANLDELNYLAGKLDDMSEGEYNTFCAAVESGNYGSDIEDYINLAESVDDNGSFPHAGEGCDRTVIHLIGQLCVNLVGYYKEILLNNYFCDGLKISPAHNGSCGIIRE